MGWLRDLHFIDQLLKSTLRPPLADSAGYDGGLISYICDDGRVRTRIYQTLETRRYSSSRPALQNISKRGEVDYARILGDRYQYPVRSVIEAAPGHVLVEADYVGAELAAMAW